jgi:hypothetical protein
MLVLDPGFLQAVNVDVLPASDNAYDLGNSSLRWRDLYVVRVVSPLISLD